MKTLIAALLFLVILPFSIMAQSSSDDPAMQEAKEETVVIFDLIRFFGFLNTMVEESPGLELSRNQSEEVYTVMLELQSMERIEADWAEETLTSLELDVLTIDQLMYMDMMIIARQSSRTSDGTGAGKNSGGGSGGGLLAGYINGGAFNPALDTSKSMGSDFAEFLNYLRDKLGK